MTGLDITKKDLLFHWEEDAKAHATMNKMSEERYAKLEAKIDTLTGLILAQNENIKPITEIYANFQGFGAISRNFFKWIVIPASVIFGIIVAMLTIIKSVSVER